MITELHLKYLDWYILNLGKVDCASDLLFWLDETVYRNKPFYKNWDAMQTNGEFFVAIRLPSDAVLFKLRWGRT